MRRCSRAGATPSSSSTPHGGEQMFVGGRGAVQGRVLLGGGAMRGRLVRWEAGWCDERQAGGRSGVHGRLLAVVCVLKCRASQLSADSNMQCRKHFASEPDQCLVTAHLSEMHAASTLRAADTARTCSRLGRQLARSSRCDRIGSGLLLAAAGTTWQPLLRWRPNRAAPGTVGAAANAAALAPAMLLSC